MMPRAAPPDDIPLPALDRRALDALARHEHEILQRATAQGLPDDTRLLGSELRRHHELQRRGDVAKTELATSKGAVERARAFAYARDGEASVEALFLVQREAYLNELHDWERRQRARAAQERDDVEESAEMRALGGPFLERLRAADWVRDGVVVADLDERRVLYKMMWASDVDLEGSGPFALGLDERRLLYRLFLRAPHPPEILRAALDNGKRRAKTAEECARAEQQMRIATEKWRIGKIMTLADFDPSYPKDYAIGLAELRLGDYTSATVSFQRALGESGDGPYAARARNFLLTARKRAEAAGGQP